MILKKEYIRENGIYLVDTKDNVSYFISSAFGNEEHSCQVPLNQIVDKHNFTNCVIVLLTEYCAPTIKICDDLLSYFPESDFTLRFLVAVVPIDKNKLFKAVQKPYELRHLWFAVDPKNEINKSIQAHGYFPKKKYEKKCCMYDYSPALFKLMASMDLSGVQCLISVNCPKKLNSALVPEDFLRIALTTKWYRCFDTE